MKRCYLIGLIAVLALPQLVAADPVQWETNGHWYEYLPELVSWEEAQVVAEGRVWNGEPGYLVTLTTPAENEFVYYQVLGGDAPAPEGDPWIGGYQNRTEIDPLGDWHWVTDEPWSWTNWAPGEPNDYDELRGEMYLQFSQLGSGMWNDHHSLNPKPVIVEYSGDVVNTESASWGDVKSLFR